MARISCALFCFLLAAAPAWAQRLPTNVAPEHYDLWFAPDLQNETFRGRETITVRLKAPATTITLNAAEITFGEVTITAAGRRQVARITSDERREMATLSVPQQIPAGTATIQISYTGILNDKLRGFYISKANNRSYAVTQMEATDARRAFPSFDEPAYKATFDIALMIDNGDVAISNGKLKADTPGPEAGKHTVTFNTSPKMSTYLVAMLVGDFACREGAADGTPIRICSTPDKRGLTAFALEAAEYQLKFFNEFFGIKYPFEKLDIIGIPDFAAGAMENIGAITFRERSLLADPENASLDVRKYVAAVISHEIAHQWFGDLVTMQWWDDIWLNEGFATWLETKPLATWHPEWQMDLDNAGDTQAALALDALRSTRSIRTKAETPDEINELFDAIAYQKTGAVLRMTEAYVGAEAFRAGITSYLKKYAYGNATGDDFWTEMTRVTGKPIDRIMKSFVDQPGTPVLRVRSSCSGNASTLTLDQQRFIGSLGAPPPAPQTWVFPACFKTTGGEPRCQVIERPTVITPGAGCDNVFANADARGYYLTEYTPDAVRALAKSARGLQATERLSLAGDEWWMVKSGRHDADLYMELAAALAGDETSAVLGAIAGPLDFTGNYLVAAADRARYQAWVRSTFGAALTEVGFPGNISDNDQIQSRRAAVLSIVGETGNDTDVQRQARELALRYIQDPASLSPTLAPTVLKVAALSGDRALYDQYLAQLDKLGAQPEEYYRYQAALAWFRDPVLVQRTLDFALSPAVRSQDTPALIGALLGAEWGREAAWTFTKTRWAALTEKLGVFQGMPRIAASVGGFCSAASTVELSSFFAANPLPSSARALQQAMERVENCTAITTRQAPVIKRWLDAGR